MATIKNATLLAIKEQIDERNERILAFARAYAETTWDAIQLAVKTGEAPKLYPIGTEFVTSYTLDGVEYEMPWIVVAHQTVIKADGVEHPGMVIQSKYATIEDIQFDAPEREESTEATAQEGLYYCGEKDGTFTMLNLATGDAVPYSSYDHVYHSIVNHKDAYQYGYNRYSHSAQRQWLNSDAGKGEWWTAQHIGDTAPNQLARRAGFMAGLATDFLSVVDPVQIRVATNTVTDGGVTDTMLDRFFLPSIEEYYGVPQAAGVEGPYWPYWQEITGLDAPSNAANDGRKIPRLSAPSGSAVVVRCRSCKRAHVYHEWYCSASGSLYYNFAHGACAAQPACVIS